MRHIDHQTRIAYPDFARAAPQVVAALRSMAKSVRDAGLDRTLVELIKVRASQINGCAYCLQLHLDWARQYGVAAAKVDCVAVWREARVYTDRERAALAWTEALTSMAGQGVSDAVYADLKVQFSETEIIALTTAVATINAWNRIAGALGFAPPEASVPAPTDAP
ncbi:MAG: carboxymuconolactone decarboxylase family protein [Acidiferrobacteraceae bacterium]